MIVLELSKVKQICSLCDRFFVIKSTQVTCLPKWLSHEGSRMVFRLCNLSPCVGTASAILVGRLMAFFMEAESLVNAISRRLNKLVIDIFYETEKAHYFGCTKIGVMSILYR